MYQQLPLLEREFEEVPFENKRTPNIVGKQVKVTEKAKETRDYWKGRMTC